MPTYLAQALSVLAAWSFTSTHAVNCMQDECLGAIVEDLMPEGLALRQLRAEFTKQTLTAGRVEDKLALDEVDKDIIQTRQANGDVTRISCVGDSITYGAQAPEGADYPNQLQQMLGPAYTVGNFGKPGATLMEPKMVPDGKYWYITTDEYKAAKQSKPDIVVMMLGTNDALEVLQYPGGLQWNESRSEAFTTAYKSLVDEFTSLDSHPTVFLMFPPTLLGYHSESLNYKLKELATQVAAAKFLSTIDPMTAFLATCPNTCPHCPGKLEERKCAWVHTDSVHPNAEGYKRIAMFVRDAIQMPA